MGSCILDISYSLSTWIMLGQSTTRIFSQIKLTFLKKKQVKFIIHDQAIHSDIRIRQ